MDVNSLKKLAGIKEDTSKKKLTESESLDECGCDSMAEPTPTLPAQNMGGNINIRDLLAVLSKLSSQDAPMEEVDEWANSPEGVDGEPREMRPPSGEVVDTSLQRYLGADPKHVKVEEDISPEAMMEAYREFRSSIEEAEPASRETYFVTHPTDGGAILEVFVDGRKVYSGEADAETNYEYPLGADYHDMHDILDYYETKYGQEIDHIDGHGADMAVNEFRDPSQGATQFFKTDLEKYKNAPEESRKAAAISLGATIGDMIKNDMLAGIDLSDPDLAKFIEEDLQDKEVRRAIIRQGYNPKMIQYALARVSD